MGKEKDKRKIKDKEEKEVESKIRVRKKKIKIVERMIRGKKVNEEIEDMKLQRKRIEGKVKKKIEQEIEKDEKNKDIEVDEMIVEEEYVGKQIVMKRLKVSESGRERSIEKKFQNIKIVVREVEEKGKEE